MVRYLALSILCFVLNCNFAAAECNFITGSFLPKLQNPEHIKSIDIKIPKSAKFASNFLQIIASKGENIPPRLKKRFNAVVTVVYKFGKCIFPAKVRQHGDWKDHVGFINGGQPIRSLDIKLQKGNVFGAIRFKLLIPETRGKKNEVLATIIARQSGFISPETFEVKTNINNTKATLIFQEAARKELIERNHRRESAIFEGDESLLWSFKNIDNLLLEPLALSRLENRKWFMKGRSSQKIALFSYRKLQRSYLNFAMNIEDRNDTILDLGKKNRDFHLKYYLSLIAMNGLHGLRPHNRKYYFNPISSVFEPIYYDGNVDLSKRFYTGFLANKKIKALIAKLQPINIKLFEELKESIKGNEIKKLFVSRVRIKQEKAISFLNMALKTYSANLESLEVLTKETLKIKIKDENVNNLLVGYKKFQRENNVSQRIVSDIYFNGTGYTIKYLNGDTLTTSAKDISKILSKNLFNHERTVFIGSSQRKRMKPKLSKININFPGNIWVTQNVTVDVNFDQKLIRFSQNTADDWVLIKTAFLKGWNILFNGLENFGNKAKSQEQRFNEFGITGCLTVYKSHLSSGKIQVNNGNCEDSVNLIDTHGSLDTVEVNNALSDAIDIDFSSVRIGNVVVSNAGNDCLDVSMGDYYIDTAKLKNCSDKGISVGESTNFEAANIELFGAKIGVSSKDSSSTILRNANFQQVKTCAEVKKKKQEFTGAFLEISNFDCIGPRLVDEASIFLQRKP